MLRVHAWDSVTFYGHGGYSTDGVGPTDGGNLTALVPPGSTVVQAYLYGSYQAGGSSSSLDTSMRTISFGGTTVELTEISKTFGASDTFYAARADVTATVVAAVGGGAGATDFAAGSNGVRLHGLALVVIYENPAKPLVSIAVMDGFALQAGDNAKLDFATPLDKTTPGFTATMALGSGWSYQTGAQDSDTCGPENTSTIDVNSQRLSSCTGGADDSPNSLITVGGAGEWTANPVDPNSTNTGTDDWPYDLAPFVSQSDTELNITTANQSSDDNIFLAVIEIAARATALANGETRRPLLPRRHR